MRFDVPLVSFALLGAASAAAFGPPGGFNVDRQFGEHSELGQIEGEIEQLEQELEHDLQEFEQFEAHQHGHPAPYHPGPPAPYAESSSSVTAAPAGTSSVESSVLASLSSVQASLSSAISLVSSVNATVTLATSTGTAISSTVIPVGSANYTVPVPFANATSSVASATGPAPAPYSAESTSASVSPVSYEQVTSTSSVAAASSAASYVAPESSSSSSDTCTDSATSYAAGTTSSASVVSEVYSTESSTLLTTITIGSTVTVSTTVVESTVTLTAAGSDSTSYEAASATYPAGPSYPAGNFSASGFPSASGSGASPYSAPSGSAFVSGTAPVIVSKPIASANSTSAAFATGTAPIVSSKPIVSANSTSAFLTGTAPSMAPTASAVANISVPANTTASSYCTNLCSTLSFDTDYATYPVSCEAYEAGSNITITGGQATAQCGTTITPSVDLCRVVLTVVTSGESSTYMEVWLPNGNTTSWNGRTLNTDNGGANGCVAFDDMQYVTGMGFAAVGDNGGHNNSAFDGGWMYFNNEAILDWGSRARHGSAQAGKQVAAQFYEQQPSYSYYLGCSTGGQQGMHSAQYAPGDFDGIIAGSAAADFNHLQGWSNRFIQLTGTGPSDDRFLTEDQWIFVQSYIFDQCDEALDGVNDGIIEDPTICEFNSSAIPVCSGNSTDNCLTSTQITTVDNVFSQLYDENGNLLYPSMLYGSQVDAFRLGMLSGSPQAIATDWYGGGVWNDSNYDYIDMNQTDYAQADLLDVFHGNISTMNADLSAFQASGAKMITYHGMADPLVSGGNSQRYYLKVAQTMGMSNTQLDDFYRYYRISGMAHCGVGGISGAGAWMFGQSAAADIPGVGDNIITNMVDWVENGNAPDTILGTKFWYDEPSLGLEFQRNHCRFPYRTTYDGTGDSTLPSSWTCEYIEDWQECGVGAYPRLCNVDGSFS